MHSPKLFKFTMMGLGLAVTLAGCGAASTTAGSGGSSSASGGSRGSSGGTTGSGGSASGGGSTGGATGSGGSASTGGSSGTGGGTATGGTGGGLAGGRNGGGGTTGSGGTAGSSGGPFTLTSPDQMEGAKFGAMYTCAAMNGTFGSGVNPELDWAGAPGGTMSFAVTFIDTTLGDTNPLGQHWAIWNIPASVMRFPKATPATLTGDLMMARQSGKFLTPCAQSVMNNMDDQYEFTVYALSTTTLNVTPGTTVANALTALKAITPLGKATLHGHAGLKGM